MRDYKFLAYGRSGKGTSTWVPVLKSAIIQSTKKGRSHGS